MEEKLLNLEKQFTAAIVKNDPEAMPMEESLIRTAFSE
jgi:hypothetical protein